MIEDLSMISNILCTCVFNSRMFCVTLQANVVVFGCRYLDSQQPLGRIQSVVLYGSGTFLRLSLD